jgi:hypothetical protein
MFTAAWLTISIQAMAQIEIADLRHVARLQR